MKMGKSFLFNDEDISPVWCLGTKEKKKTAGGSFYSQISILFENLIKVSSVLNKTNITNWKAINY